MIPIELTLARKEALRKHWQTKSLTELADFIEPHYHARAREFIPVIAAEIDEICKSTPQDLQDVVIPLKHLRAMLTEDMEKHTQEEEEVLFPYVRKLEADTARGNKLRSASRIHNEHDQIIDLLVKTKLETTLCRLPDLPCAHCRPLNDRLAILLADLQEHAFLEDDILFLEALELEKHQR